MIHWISWLTVCHKKVDYKLFPAFAVSGHKKIMLFYIVILHLNVRVVYVGNFILFSALPSLPSTLSGSAAGRRSYSTWSCSWGSGIRTGWCGERTKETQHQKKWMRKVIRKKKATTRDDDDEMRERGKSKCGKNYFYSAVRKHLSRSGYCVE